MQRAFGFKGWVVGFTILLNAGMPSLASASLTSWDHSSPSFQAMVRVARKEKKSRPPEPENDEAIGRNEHASLLRAGLKLSDKPEEISRVERIGRQLVAALKTAEMEPLYGKRSTEGFPFRFFVVQDDSINAFALPGGYIYVHTGLLEFVRSDAELAGVMGHEIIHSWHRHGWVLSAEADRIAARYQWGTLGAILGSVIARFPLEVALAGYYAGPLWGQSKVSELSRRAESDADHGAVPLLRAAGIDPVGILTLLEKLGLEAQKRGFPEYGIYQSHPDERSRVLQVQSQLVKLGLPIRRRATNGVLSVSVLARLERGCLELAIASRPILCADPGTVAPFAERLDSVMDLALSMALVYTQGSALVVDAGSDSRLEIPLESPEVALQARDALRQALWRAEFEKTDALYAKGQRQGSAI